MSGGVGRVARDCAADYAEDRRRVFGIDLAPLPASRALSEPDLAFNRGAKLAG